LEDVPANTSTAKPEIVEEAPVPEMGLTLEFGYSTSSNFDFAVEAARQLPNFRQVGEGRKAQYQVNLPTSQITDSIELVGYIKGWKSARVYVDGDKTTWDSVYSFLYCYQQRNASFKPELYCFGYDNDYQLNIWGCIRADMPFREHAKWVDWGHWVNKRGLWEFDKERIRHELQKNLYKYRFCPALNLELAEDALAAFPDQVNPRRNKNWKFVESYSGQDGLSSALVVKTKRYGFEEEVIMKGVAPSGPGAIREIMKRMSLRLPDSIAR
jgi:hypothetical protein